MMILPETLDKLDAQKPSRGKIVDEAVKKWKPKS